MLTAAVKAKSTSALHDACGRDREAMAPKNVAARGTIAVAHSL